MKYGAFRFAGILAAALAFELSNAQTLAYSCNNPTGRSLGVLGEIGKFRPLDEPDSMKGGMITLLWSVRENSAKITVDTGAGGAPLSTNGILFFKSEEQASFVEVFPGAAYMFTIFLPGRHLLVSSHQQFLSMDPGSAIAKTFEAKCERTVQSR